MGYLRDNFWKAYVKILFWFSLVCVTVATLRLPSLESPTLEITLLVYGLLIFAVALKRWKPSFAAAVSLRNLLQLGAIGLFYVTRRDAEWQRLFDALPGTAFLKQFAIAVSIMVVIFFLAYGLTLVLTEMLGESARSESQRD
jgi:hypothetical protein